MIVLEDADLEAAVAAANFGAFMNQGQICMSTERIVVESPIAELFARELAAKASALKVGDPSSPIRRSVRSSTGAPSSVSKYLLTMLSQRAPQYSVVEKHKVPATCQPCCTV